MGTCSSLQSGTSYIVQKDAHLESSSRQVLTDIGDKSLKPPTNRTNTLPSQALPERYTRPNPDHAKCNEEDASSGGENDENVNDVVYSDVDPLPPTKPFKDADFLQSLKNRKSLRKMENIRVFAPLDEPLHRHARSSSALEDATNTTSALGVGQYQRRVPCKVKHLAPL
eukprot:GEMP01111570.1.p1 GENE.GEMP01111570.1~~GEMP01111570.1.p1  ORF type:complete len:169 (+),score=35.46 GEMP01111570.1:81-587(+)